MYFKNYFSFFVGCLCACFLYVDSNAQADYPKEKISLESDIWMGASIQFQEDSLNTFFVQALGRNSTTSNDDDFFYEKYLALTYERKLNKTWVGGISYRHQWQNIQERNFRLHIRHYSNLEKLQTTFFQQLAFERATYNNDFYEAVSRLRFQFALLKRFHVSPQKTLTGSFSIECFKEIQHIESGAERRFFQENRIQTEWHFPLSKRVYIGAYAGLQTNYFIALAQYNMNNELIKPTRRLNLQRPYYGFQAAILVGKNSTLSRRIWSY